MSSFGSGSKVSRNDIYSISDDSPFNELLKWFIPVFIRQHCAHSGQVKPRETDLNKNLNKQSFNAYYNYSSTSIRDVNPFFLMTEESGEKVLSLNLSISNKRVAANIKAIAGSLQCTVKPHKSSHGTPSAMRAKMKF